MKNARPALIDVCPALENVRRALIAVSGGGDSVAMLHYLATHFETTEYYVATVDHGLRSESASEAKFVSDLAADFGLPHETLKWDPPNSASSEDARLARYELLVRHALEVGATAIVLGHTLDDQAETIMMRARRMKADSGTRGLSGIPELATHALAPGRRVSLLRPFLNTRRSELREYLTDNRLDWIDDPSNENPASERVRIRSELNANSELPDAKSIMRLADLSARTRHWLNCRTSYWLRENMQICGGGHVALDATDSYYPTLENVFSTLICVAGGLEYRPSPAKLTELIEAFQSRSRLRRNVGRVLVTVSPGGASFEREARNKIGTGARNEPLDGRFFIDRHGEITPFIAALERFRPACDEPLYDIIRSKFNEAATESILE